MDIDQIKRLLRQVKTGRVSVDGAMERLRHLPYEDLGFSKIDSHRSVRRGFPEVIFCQGKTPDQIIAIAERMHQRGTSVLATLRSACLMMTVHSSSRLLSGLVSGVLLSTLAVFVSVFEASGSTCTTS